jgi:hypothetical protein
MPYHKLISHLSKPTQHQQQKQIKRLYRAIRIPHHKLINHKNKTTQAPKQQTIIKLSNKIQISLYLKQQPMKPSNKIPKGLIKIPKWIKHYRTHSSSIKERVLNRPLNSHLSGQSPKNSLLLKKLLRKTQRQTKFLKYSQKAPKITMHLVVDRHKRKR